MTISADQVHGLYVCWQDAIAGSGMDTDVQNALHLIASAQIDFLFSPTADQLEFITSLHSWFDKNYCGNGHPQARGIHEFLQESLTENVPRYIPLITGIDSHLA